MKRLLLDPNNPASVVNAVREFLTETQTVFMGMIDKVPDALKDQVKELRSKLDAALTQLASKPTEQVPAALDASYMIRSCENTLNYMAEVMTETLGSLNKLVAEYGPKQAALTALHGRIEKKELVESTDADKARKDAVDAAVKAERDRAKLLSERRTILAKADLPLPLEDAALEGEPTVFDALKTKTASRFKQLKEIGQLTACNAEDLSKLVYGPDESFNVVIKMAGGKGSTSTKPGDIADPLLGGKTTGAVHKRFAIA
jgi:hypothetical protein